MDIVKCLIVVSIVAAIAEAIAPKIGGIVVLAISSVVLIAWGHGKTLEQIEEGGENAKKN